MCKANPYSVISFLGQNGGSSLHHQTYFEQEVITFGSISLKSLWWHIYVCLYGFVHEQAGNPEGANFCDIPQLLLSPVQHGVLWQTTKQFPQQSPSSPLWWVHQLSALCIQLWQFLVDYSMADQWSIFPSLKYFTLHLTLIAYPHTQWRCPQMPAAK